MLFIFCIIVSFLVYCLLRKSYEYWKIRGVPYPKPTLLVGNVGPSLVFKKPMGELFIDIYNDYPDSACVGFYRGCKPNLLIRDTEFIKNIMVKNFRSFNNNDIFIDFFFDPLFGRNPFALKDQAWKRVRSQLTPSFTSGKMKFVFPLLEDVSNKMIGYLNRNCVFPTSKPMESKELCSMFTVDNVASCAFGVDGKCFEQHSEFKELTSKYFKPTSWAAIKLLILFLVPSLANFVSLKIIKKEADKKVKDLVLRILQHRESINTPRNDFLDLMVQLRGKNKDFSTDDIIGHAAGFIGDGFETTSTVMSFILYELASHQHVQDKLREEIEASLENNNGKFTYESILGMEYLNAVILESLRKNPTNYAFVKLCTEKYTYETQEDSEYKKMSLTIDPGTPLIIPVAALAMDKKYFPNPEIYDPERFTGENKNNYNKYAFMPFGEGPRQCLGQRFGMLQIKVGVAHIIKNFKMSINKKTIIPLRFDPFNILMAPVGGLWIDFKKVD